MGIKDNFSQAVKELWKKDGMEDANDAPVIRDGVPTQLDQYLAQSEETPVQAQTSAPVQNPTVAQSTAPQPTQAADPSTVLIRNDEQPAPPVPAPAAADARPQEANSSGVPLETPYYRPQPAPEQPTQSAAAPVAQNTGFSSGYAPQNTGYNANDGFGGGNVPPSNGNVNANRAAGVTDEVTVISRNTIIDGNVRSLANMQVDGNIKGNVETTRDIDMTGKVVGDIKCNNASMNSAAMQGNIISKGKMRMDRDTILIGDLTSQYADVNGRIRGKLEIAGKAELKRDAIVFGDINASTIAVTDGAIIQGYVNTTFLSKEDSRNAFPDAITLEASAKPDGTK